MKTQILRSASILSLFFLLAAVNVNAQTASRLEVNIPFDFSAGKATLKAGSYTIKKISENAIAIRSGDGATTAFVNAPLTIDSHDPLAAERLVFNKYGEHYFLSQVWLSVETGRQLFTTGAETKTARAYRLANKNAKPERVDVAVRQK